MKRAIYLSCLSGIALSLVTLGLTAEESNAALIQSIEFKGGGCVMSADSGSCTSASYQLDGFEVRVEKDFSKVESEGHEDGSSGHNGNCHGSGGKPSTAGHSDSEEPHEHDSLFEKLPPIHMFITLRNDEFDTDGLGDTYTFNEEIVNNMGIPWDGFFFALKMNEDNRALFENTPLPFSDTFGELELKGKKMTWSGGMDEQDLPATLAFSFDVTFFNVAEDLLDSSGNFHVMLQEFPLVASEPIPEPATMLLFGAGLAGLAGVRRRRKE